MSRIVMSRMEWYVFLLRENDKNNSLGSDVEIVSSAIWFETEIYVLNESEWQKFSHKGFNPKRGKNISSPLNIYLHNDCSHYEQIVSVISRKESENIACASGQHYIQRCKK